MTFRVWKGEHALIGNRGDVPIAIGLGPASASRMIVRPGRATRLRSYWIVESISMQDGNLLDALVFATVRLPPRRGRRRRLGPRPRGKLRSR